MCGIAGIVQVNGPSRPGDLAQTILDRLRHRGPDDHGWLSYSREALHAGRGKPYDGPCEVMLLHRRLSILDLSEAGWQPMDTPDGRYHIVFNGEIYNYLELRDQLAEEGCEFHTGTDTEVLLAAFARWGPDALPRLVGMFAFAVLDTRERTLFLARDHFGIKPLFYTVTSQAFAFASEIKGLLEVPGVRRCINPQAVYTYLRFGTTDHNSETLLQGVRHLPPAHYVEISLDSSIEPRPRRYWSLNHERRADCSFAEAASTVRELFLDSVRLHMRSDVPVGSCLSGGIDSSAIVMGMREQAGREIDINSFSYIADDPQLDEEPWVDMVAAAAATKVHKVRPTPEELVADLDHLIAVQDEPFGSTSVYAQHRVFRMAHETGTKVLLDGQGADEMLAGYRICLSSRLAGLLLRGRLIAAGRFFRAASRLPGVDARRVLMIAASGLTPGWLQRPAMRLVSEELMPGWLDHSWCDERGVVAGLPLEPSAMRSQRATLVDTFFRTILPSLLRFEDRNSMAFSIESRVPFLTPQLVEFLFSLPDDYVLGSDGTSKRVFRAAMRGLVPDPVLDRRDKIGFATPEQSWLAHLRPWVDSVLASDAAREVPVLNYDAVAEECSAVFAGRKRFDWRIWRWLNLVRWSDQLGVRY